MLASTSHAQLSIQKVKVTGETAPGALGSVFEYILVPQTTLPPPATADGAFSLFVSSTRGAVGELRDYGVFGGLTGGLQPLFLANAPAPGTNGAVFAGNRMENMATSVVVNDAGVAAMFGFLSGGDTVAGQNDIGIWTGKPGHLQLFVRGGQTPPAAVGDERWYNFDPPGLGNGGQIVFRADTTVGRRIYAGSSPANLRRIASNGDPAPITIPNRDDPLTLGISGFRPHGYTTRINGAGQVAFGATISGFSVAQDAGGIFYSGGSGVQVLAHNAQNRFSFNAPLSPGSEAPGTGNRGRFTQLQTFEINEAGQVAFVSQFTSDEIGGTGIWIGTPGALQLIARSGQDSGIDGAELGQISVTQPRGFVSYSGEVVFHAAVGDSRHGIFRARAGSLTPIAWSGQSAAHEAGPGWTFAGFGEATINDAGEVAFTAFLQNGSEQSVPSLWVANARNELRLVARRGALFQVAPEDNRTVDAILASRIDQEGQVVFTLAFQDLIEDRQPGDDLYRYTSGVFIAGLPPIVDDRDTDGDGLMDRWERDGVTIDGVRIDLPAMGADPRHKNIFVHADWMAGDPARPGVVFKPDPRAIKMVVDAFAVAPVSNPDGRPGIDLHVDLGPDSPLDVNGRRTWGALSRAGEVPFQQSTGTFSGGDYQWNAVDQLKATRFGAAKRNKVFHYALFANSYGGSSSSGISRGIPGNDFLVTLGTWRTPGGTLMQQAGTFMHEFGHNLGLQHGGGDSVNHKPNYTSIMNYAFQLVGLLKSDGVQRSFDYSRRKLNTLNETGLVEAVGIGDPVFRTFWSRRTRPDSPPGSNECLARPNDYFSRFGPVLDWSCNGTNDGSPVIADVNGDGVCVAPGVNATLDTAASGDDVVIANRITAGANRTCDTAATGDDVLEQDVGFKQPDNLTGFNDWPAVQFKGDGTIGAAGAAIPELMSTPVDEPTEEKLLDLVPPALLDEELVAPLDLVSASTDRGSAPLEVTFDGGASTAKLGSIVDWHWDFGDGNTGSGATVTHTYTTPGEYFASLTVTDSGGRKNLVPLLTRITVTADTPAGRALNISTRMRVETGDNVLIAGFIVTGDQPRKVMIRGLGPSLPVSGALANPRLDLDDGTIVNDDWRTDQEAEIIATTIPPQSDFESAIVATLAPGPHTAILSGNSGGTGVGLVEVYELDSGTNARLANISSRGFVQTGDDVMIGGFIIGGSNPAQMLIRAIGPSLPVAGALQDPMLELVDSNGNSISNDNWADTQSGEIIATTIPPAHENEAAILAPLTPGAYTAVLRGKGETVGIALVEAYHIQ